MREAPGVVALHLWGVPRRQVAAAVLAMARDRRGLHRQPGLTFGKLLGTGSGRTFMPGDADPRHWGALTCWRDQDSADRFEASELVGRWEERCEERLRIRLAPLASRGRWAGQEPFGSTGAERSMAPGPEQPVAALTRARIRPRMWRTFWAAVPQVSGTLAATPGLLFRIGIGEAPVGLQGTFSLWSSTDALHAFAYRGAEHRAAIDRTHELGWYAEELFARFAVLSVQGTYHGRPVTLGPT